MSVKQRVLYLFCKIPDDMLALVSRAAIATVFWKAAQTKITGWVVWGQSLNVFNVTQSTIDLFAWEYELPLMPPAIAAYMATFAEFFLSIAIILGFMTRFSALMLLVMTVVIQVFVYPNAWSVHLLWATGLLYLMKNGAGHFSVDYLLARK